MLNVLKLQECLWQNSRNTVLESVGGVFFWLFLRCFFWASVNKQNPDLHYQHNFEDII